MQPTWFNLHKLSYRFLIVHVVYCMFSFICNCWYLDRRGRSFYFINAVQLVLGCWWQFSFVTEAGLHSWFHFWDSCWPRYATVANIYALVKVICLSLYQNFFWFWWCSITIYEPIIVMLLTLACFVANCCMTNVLLGLVFSYLHLFTYFWIPHNKIFLQTVRFADSQCPMFWSCLKV